MADSGERPQPWLLSAPDVGAGNQVWPKPRTKE